MTRGIGRKGLFATGAVLLVLIFLIFLVVDAYSGRPGPVSVRITPDVRVMLPDDVYGWRYRPGSYEVAILDDGGEPLHAFTMTIGDDGYRLSASRPARGAAEVWLLGGSFTYGWCVDDEETYPWLLQEALPDATIRNLGVSGWGTGNALIQLRHWTRIANDPPRVVVVQFIESHLERNVGAPSHIAAFSGGFRGSVGEEEGAQMMETLRFPRGRLDPDEGLSIDLVTIAEGRVGQDPDMETAYAVTEAMLEEIAALCGEWEIRPIIFSSDVPIDERVAAMATRLGYEVVSTRTSWDTDDLSCSPADPSHPNGAGHAIFAEALEPVIRSALLAAD